MIDLSNAMLESLEDSFGSVPYARLENESLSLLANEKLRQSFIARKDPQPPMFGSVYLDEDGILVVNVVDNDPHLIDEINEALKGEKYYIRGVVYPWSFLKSTLEIMNTQLALNRDDAILKNFVSFYVDERNNRIMVELLDISEEAAAVFKAKIMDSPTLVFEKAVGQLVLTANVNCGSGMTSLSGGMSVGYRVTKNSTLNYVVTAGHGFTSTGTSATAYIGGVNVGYCTSRIMTNCDAALVAITNSGYTASNILNISTAYSLGTLVTAAISGSTFFKEGTTTGYTSGTCTSTSFTSSTITDLVLVERPAGNAMVQPGDSGGVFYGINRTTVGITTGYISTTNRGVFSKASNINNAFATVRY